MSFYPFQSFIYRSAVIRNLADLITYRRKYASHTELYAQLMMIWAECCVTYCELVISAKMEQLIEQSSGSINPLSMSIRFDVFMNACDDICEKRITAKCAIQYIDGQLSLNELLQFIFQVCLHFIVYFLSVQLQRMNMQIQLYCRLCKMVFPPLNAVPLA